MTYLNLKNHVDNGNHNKNNYISENLNTFKDNSNPIRPNTVSLPLTVSIPNEPNYFCLFLIFIMMNINSTISSSVPPLST